jgi:hypothetical protein
MPSFNISKYACVAILAMFLQVAVAFQPMNMPVLRKCLVLQRLATIEEPTEAVAGAGFRNDLRNVAIIGTDYIVISFYNYSNISNFCLLWL